MLKNKSIVNDDLGYCGIPYQAVKLFIQTSPLVSYCSTFLVISNLCYLCMLTYPFILSLSVRALDTIVANSITPRILQSDNGAEVCSPILRCLLFRICINLYSVFALSIVPFYCNLIYVFFLFPIHHQFLGHCVKLINKEFPHIHVVKGKARKLTTQGSIEVSHKAFKEALVTCCNNTGSNDWVYGSYM